MWLQDTAQTMAICMVLGGNMGHSHQHGPQQGWAQLGWPQAPLLMVLTDNSFADSLIRYNIFECFWGLYEYPNC